jgi:hypothetical protein
LALEVRDRTPKDGVRLGWSARITLASEDPTPEGPLEVFRVRAGLSSTRVLPSVKRGYYGLAFLVAERIGIEELRALCERATAAGHSRLPRAWALRAAGLDESSDTWRRAASAAMGKAELIELVRTYPSVVAGALAHYLGKLEGTPAQRWDSIEGRLSLVEGEASVELAELSFLRGEVLARLE